MTGPLYSSTRAIVAGVCYPHVVVAIDGDALRTAYGTRLGVRR